MVTQFSLMCPGISLRDGVNLKKVFTHNEILGQLNCKYTHINKIPYYLSIYIDAFLSTLVHDLHLYDDDNLIFKQICNRKAVRIEYDDDPYYSDVEISDNKLIEKSTNNWEGTNVYNKRQNYMPDTSMTDTVGDTELISTFIQRTNITDITWIHWWDNVNLTDDVAVCPFMCKESTTNAGSQCVPPHRHYPWYIWTRYPKAVPSL